MHGLTPLTYDTLDGWSRLTGHVPTPHEVAALFALDAVMRSPGTDGEEDE